MGKKCHLSDKQKSAWKTILKKANKDKKYRHDLEKNFEKVVGGSFGEQVVPEGNLVWLPDASAIDKRRVKADPISDENLEKVWGGVNVATFDDGAGFYVETSESTEELARGRHGGGGGRHIMPH
jgi:hypothetical protein